MMDCRTCFRPFAPDGAATECPACRANTWWTQPAPPPIPPTVPSTEAPRPPVMAVLVGLLAFVALASVILFAVLPHQEAPREEASAPVPPSVVLPPAEDENKPTPEVVAPLQRPEPKRVRVLQGPRPRVD